MYHIEFQTEIENGNIEVPREYRRRLQERSGGRPVRVIILMPEDKPVRNAIDDLLDNPIEVADFTPLDRADLHERN